MKELLLTLLDIVGLAYWLEITTEKPECTYYFGPFASREEAISMQSGYLEDLSNEGAENKLKKLEFLERKVSKAFSLFLWAIFRGFC